MQQGQQEAFLAKFRNWAGKPLGQNFAPQGEGKKKKKKKKKKSGRSLKKNFRTACSCPWSYHPPLQRRGLQRPKSEIRTLRVPFFSRDRAVRLFSCFLCFPFDCHPEGHWVQVHTVTAYPSYSDWDKQYFSFVGGSQNDFWPYKQRRMVASKQIFPQDISPSHDMLK